MNRKEALNYLVDNVERWDEGGFHSLSRQNITELFNGGWISICGFVHKGNERYITREDWVEAKRIMNKHECIEWAVKNIGDWDKMKTRGKPYMPKGWHCDQSGDVVFYTENFEAVIYRKDWVEAKKAMNRKYLNKQDLMMKAVIKYKGKLPRVCNGLIYESGKNKTLHNDDIKLTDIVSETDLLGLRGGSGAWIWLCSRDEFDKFIDDLIETCIKYEKKEWDGIGLPPVGSYVNIVDDGTLVYGSGESGEVVAHVEGAAVVRMSYGFGCFKPRVLEPLKTEAEKERERLIDLASKAMEMKCGFVGSTAYKKYAAALVDAGWTPDESHTKDN